MRDLSSLMDSRHTPHNFTGVCMLVLLRGWRGSGGGQEPQWNRGSLRLRGILRAAAGVSLKLSVHRSSAVPKTYHVHV